MIRTGSPFYVASVWINNELVAPAGAIKPETRALMDKVQAELATAKAAMESAETAETVTVSAELSPQASQAPVEMPRGADPWDEATHRLPGSLL